ncbi:MAG: hypothetical protein M3Z87_00650 [Lactobacillus sp.]|nr:hypothetical protein [Lactobacillus sp.]
MGLFETIQKLAKQRGMSLLEVNDKAGLGNLVSIIGKKLHQRLTVLRKWPKF